MSGLSPGQNTGPNGLHGTKTSRNRKAERARPHPEGAKAASASPRSQRPSRARSCRRALSSPAVGSGCWTGHGHLARPARGAGPPRHAPAASAAGERGEGAAGGSSFPHFPAEGPQRAVRVPTAAEIPAWGSGTSQPDRRVAVGLSAATRSSRRIDACHRAARSRAERKSDLRRISRSFRVDLVIFNVFLNSRLLASSIKESSDF